MPEPTPTRRGERWSMGFTLDTLADGGAFRTSMQNLHALVPTSRRRPRQDDGTAPTP